MMLRDFEFSYLKSGHEKHIIFQLCPRRLRNVVYVENCLLQKRIYSYIINSGTQSSLLLVFQFKAEIMDGSDIMAALKCGLDFQGSQDSYSASRMTWVDTIEL